MINQNPESNMIQIDQQNAVATVTLNNPAKRNRLSIQAMSDLCNAFQNLNSNPDIRVVVITGSGDKAFCAGADLGEFDRPGIVSQRKQNLAYRNLCLALYNMQKPVVARVNGAAVAGGMALVTLSHLAVASTTARFGTPEIQVGAFPNMVMSAILRAIPKKAAMKLILLGEIIDAAEALEMGLVNAVVTGDLLDKTVANIVDRLAAKSSAIFGLGLDSVRVSSDMPYPQALEYLCEMATIIRNTDDCQEGAKAFLEKREPIWKGR